MVWAVAISDDGKKIVTGSGDKKLRVFDGDSLTLLKELRSLSPPWTCISQLTSTSMPLRFYSQVAFEVLSMLLAMTQ